MSTLSDYTRLSDDDRYELASRAVMHERKSRPVHLVVFGIIVFVVSTIFLAYNWQYNRDAERKLNSNKVAAINIDRMISQIATLELAQEQTPEDDMFQPIPDILTRLARIGEGLGLTINLPRNTQPNLRDGARVLSYPYTLRDPSLEKILDWIQRSQDQIPGLQVREITINLNAQSWLVKVTLTRYERVE